MRIRVTDYIDTEGNLRCCYCHPALANSKIGVLIGRRYLWGERYEDIGGCRTWSEAREMHDVDVMDNPTTVNR